MRLPDFTLAGLRRSRTTPTPRRAATLDALVVVLSPSDTALLRRLPESQRWLALHSRDKATALKSRSTTLANERQTSAVIGYAKSDASSLSA